MGNEYDPMNDWWMNPMNPASPLHHLMFPDDEEKEESHMDSGSQFDRTNWTTTGMDSDYIDDDEVSDQGGNFFPVVANIPPTPVHQRAPTLLEDIWDYIKRTILGEKRDT